MKRSKTIVPSKKQVVKADPKSVGIGAKGLMYNKA